MMVAMELLHKIKKKNEENKNIIFLLSKFKEIANINFFFTLCVCVYVSIKCLRARKN